jgi:hypothetical protein
MTALVALGVLLLVGGIAVAMIKRALRLAAFLAVVALLLVGAAIFVIGNMK